MDWQDFSVSFSKSWSICYLKPQWAPRTRRRGLNSSFCPEELTAWWGIEFCFQPSKARILFPLGLSWSKIRNTVTCLHKDIFKVNVMQHTDYKDKIKVIYSKRTNMQTQTLGHRGLQEVADMNHWPHRHKSKVRSGVVPGISMYKTGEKWFVLKHKVAWSSGRLLILTFICI